MCTVWHALRILLSVSIMSMPKSKITCITQPFSLEIHMHLYTYKT